MDLSKLKNFIIDTTIKNTIIDKLDNINHIIDTLHFCYSNKIPCLITDKSTENIDLKHPITLIYNGNISTLSWENLNTYNNFIRKKYKIKDQFSIGASIFNIFFLKLIDNNYDLLNKDSDLVLVGSNKCVFGIYNTFQDNIFNCNNMLYYSFNLSTFILYKVYNTTNYIVGKLPKFIKYDNQHIRIKDKKYKCPNTFICLNKDVYGIRKRNIEFLIENHNIIQVSKTLEQYDIFNNYFNNQCIYYLNIGKNLNKTMLENLHKYIVLTCPDFKNKNNRVLYEPDNYQNIKTYLSLYMKNISGNDYLILHINQLLTPYVKFIIQTINKFFKNLSKKNIMNIEQYHLVKKNTNTHIHIVSELYYLIVCILLYFPKTLNNIKITDNYDYIQVNYIFNTDEIKILYEGRNKSFESMSIYLKSIFIKTLSIFMENYYCIIQDNEGIDLIPIYNNMSNQCIINLLDRSTKAGLSKSFLLSFLCTVFSNINNNMVEFPIIFININKIDVIPNGINIKKVYATSENKNIPFFINVVYSDTSLHISLSYKEKYKKLKYIFNEVIEQLLEK